MFGTKTKKIAALEAKCAALQTALDHAMAIVNETAVPRMMYGMEVEDPQHPWHDDVMAIRRALESIGQ